MDGGETLTQTLTLTFNLFTPRARLEKFQAVSPYSNQDLHNDNMHVVKPVNE